MVRRTLSAFAVALALVAATFVAGVLISEAPTPVEAKGPCICPLIYAPVTCDHNRTFPNQCEADCHNAKNCVPSGI